MTESIIGTFPQWSRRAPATLAKQGLRATLFFSTTASFHAYCQVDKIAMQLTAGQSTFPERKSPPSSSITVIQNRFRRLNSISKLDFNNTLKKHLETKIKSATLSNWQQDRDVIFFGWETWQLSIHDIDRTIN